MVLEAGKSKSKVLTDSVSGEGPLTGAWTAIFFTVSFLGRNSRELSGVAFIRALIPPNHLPKGHHIGALVLTYELGGTQAFSPQQTWLFLALFYS